MGQLHELNDEQLRAKRAELQSKIDGPENDGRLTVSSSMTLDHWFDQLAAVDQEIAERTRVVQ